MLDNILLADHIALPPSSNACLTQVESGDVGFMVSFTPDGEGSEKAIEVAVPWSRRPHRIVHRGEWKLPSSFSGGVVTLHWDNSYSRLRSKAVTLDFQRIA